MRRRRVAIRSRHRHSTVGACQVRLDSTRARAFKADIPRLRAQTFRYLQSQLQIAVGRMQKDRLEMRVNRRMLLGVLLPIFQVPVDPLVPATHYGRASPSESWADSDMLAVPDCAFRSGNLI